MSSPVQLSDLPVASSAADSDLMLLRKGLTDYQCSVSIIRSINIAAFATLPGGFANNTDLLMIQRNLSSYQIQFSQIGFIKGTQCWFYQGAAPTGWIIVPDTGDRLLGVSSGGSAKNKYGGNTAAGAQGGTWQQEGVGGGNGGLTAAQIPPHTHEIPTGKDPTGTDQVPQLANRSKTVDSSRIISLDGSPNLKGQPHDHGQTWRPAANVGLIAKKNS